MAITLTFLKTLSSPTGLCTSQHIKFHIWGENTSYSEMVLFIAVSQNDSIPYDKQETVNKPNLTNLQIITCINHTHHCLKRVFWEKRAYFPFSMRKAQVLHTMWSSDKALSFCVPGFGFDSHQSKCTCFYFFPPKLLKLQNMACYMSNNKLLPWFAVHINPTTTVCQWHQLTLFTLNFLRFVKVARCFCNKYMLPLGGSQCHTDMKKKSDLFIRTCIVLLG
jgi:hypothetical protein